MTDLEMTRLAAEAIGHTGISENKNGLSVVLCDGDIFFDPLHDPAQAFELQEKLRMDILSASDGYYEAAIFNVNYENSAPAKSDFHTDLRRAIVECAARYALWKREKE